MTLRAAIASTLTITATLALFVFGIQALGVDAQHRRLTRLDYAPPPEGMAFVPAGDFFMGTDDPNADPDEWPLRKRFIPAFHIDIYEVTNRQFQTFDPTHTFPIAEAHRPVTGISKEAAIAYAAALGKRLPTAAEWEKAARGSDGRAYPWGNDYRANIANIGGGEDLVDVGSFPESVSPYGVHDMIGNAWEWTSDVYRDAERLGITNLERNIIKGGGYSYSPNHARASYQGFESIGATCNDLGFRLVKEAKPLPPTH